MLSLLVTLDNGIKLRCHTINITNIKYNKDIEVQVDSFVSKDFYLDALKKDNYKREQQIYINEFNILNNKAILTDDEKTKQTELFNKINELAKDIELSKNYSSYVLLSRTYIIPFIEDFSINSIEKELIKLDDFKKAEIK